MTPEPPRPARSLAAPRLDAGIAGDLYDYVARRYDPVLARFIQPDTIVPDPGDPQALNRYSYVGNNPVKYVEPTGHCEETGDEACWGIYEQIVQECPECEEMEWVYGSGRSLDEADIYYLQMILELVKEGWRPPEQQPFALVIANALTPENGTVGGGVNLTGGAGAYLSGSVAIFQIDSEGNVVLLSPTLGGGGVAGVMAEVTGFVMFTNAENIYQLEGWFVNAGGGGDIGLAVGGDYLWFKEHGTKKQFTGQMYNAGLGLSSSPFPGVEAHGGFSYTWLTPLRFNIYDALSVPRPNAH